MLEELAGKGCLGGEARVTTEGRLVVAGLILGGGGCGEDAATGLGRADRPGVVGGRMLLGCGLVPEEGLDVAQADLDLVNLSLTEGSSQRRGFDMKLCKTWSVLLGGDEDSPPRLLWTLAEAGGGAGTLGGPAVGARPVLVAPSLRK